MKSLLQLLDACGMLGQDRTMIKINVYADASIGYWPLAIPVKNLNFKGQYLPCPMVSYYTQFDLISTNLILE
jgi:hypothetical protein